MFVSSRDLGDYTVRATDGPIGRITEIYFDDWSWVIKYLVVDLGHGLSVLVPPKAIAKLNTNNRVIQLTFTKKQLQQSEPSYMHKPVARQHPIDYSILFGWPPLGGSFAVHDVGDHPSTLNGPAVSEREKGVSPEESFRLGNDARLRTTSVVGKYHIMALDGEIGHVEGFLFDDEALTIRYAVADTRNWWPGKKVLLPTALIICISWAEGNAYVGISRERIVHAPEFDEKQPVTREYEAKLFAYYERLPYWQPHRAVANQPV